jgi:hypothetical protein
MCKKSEMINKKFGKLVVLSEHSKTRNGHIRYECVCECGNKTNVLGTHLRQGNTISCGCANKKGSDRKQWTGIGEMSGDFWYNHIVRSATGSKGRKEIELTITKEYVWDLFIKQNRKCSLSGIELTFPTKHKDKTYTASLDRIDSSKGYIEGNVQWVHKDINMMKRIYSQEYFINMCKLVAENN